MKSDDVNLSASRWVLDRYPFTFILLNFEGRDGVKWRAVLELTDSYWESRECRTQSAALRSLKSMRDRLIRQLQDKT
jgi:hypothetical protein